MPTVLDPISLSVIITLLAVPATVLGNEGALRLGRHRSISTVMTTSAVVAFAIALLVSAHPTVLLVLLLLYAVTLPGDSGALTSGMAMSANPADRGATIALHSMIGFGMAALGGIAVTIPKSGSTISDGAVGGIPA